MYNPYVKDFVCDKFRNSEVHQFWLTMLVIYAFEWPAYAFTAKGGKEFLVELVKTVRAEQQSKVWAEMKACGMQSAFIQGVGFLPTKNKQKQLFRVQGQPTKGSGSLSLSFRFCRLPS